MLFHIVKQSTARIIFPVAKTSTIHGRYLPIFIKTVSIIITPSIFFVLGIALEDDGSFSGMQVCLYSTTSNLTIDKCLLIFVLMPYANQDNDLLDDLHLAWDLFSNLIHFYLHDDLLHQVILFSDVVMIEPLHLPIFYAKAIIWTNLLSQSRNWMWTYLYL
jgi:hypothetical protein